MITNKMNLPKPFVDAATSSHEYKPNRYSVTEVLGGTCEAVLKRRHHGEQDEDVSERIWQIIGTAVHKILQEAEATDTQLQENWLSIPIDGTKYELSGIFDLYDDADGTVTDYKTTGTIKWQKQEFDDYRMQTLIYCLMLRKHGIAAHRGQVLMILRDWVKSKARFDKDYPQSQVQKVCWDFTMDDFEDAERRVREWFGSIAEQERLNDDELVPCSPEKRWHRDDKFAVMQKGRRRALRVLDSRKQADEWASENGIDMTNAKYYVEERKGEDVKCEMYCPVAVFCPYYQELMRRRERES